MQLNNSFSQTNEIHLAKRKISVLKEGLNTLYFTSLIVNSAFDYIASLLSASCLTACFGQNLVLMIKPEKVEANISR